MKIMDITATRVPRPPQKIVPTWNSIVQQERSEGTRPRFGTRLEVRTDEGVTGYGFEADATVLGRLRDLLIERYEPYWFEEPIRPDDYRGQGALCAALDIPVASGENEFTRWGFRDLIEAEAVDIVQADPRTCGGFTEWLKIAALASAYHLPMAPHGGPHVGAQCVGAVSNGLIVESYVHSIQAHLKEFVQPPDINEGHVTLPDRPGLGLIWHEDAIQKRLRAQ